MIELIIAAFWITCGVVGYGQHMGQLHVEFANLLGITVRDLLFGVFVALWGPIGLVTWVFVHWWVYGRWWYKPRWYITARPPLNKCSGRG